MFECPHCHTKLADPAPLSALADVQLGFHMRNMLDALVKAYPGGITRNKMVDVLYAGAAVTLTADNIVSVTVIRLRKHLEPHGWTMRRNRAAPGVEGQYKLEKIA